MQFTRRYWAVVGVAGVLGATAAVTARPVMLLAAAGVGAWLVGSQYAFTAELSRLDRTLSVDQSVTPDRGSTTRPFQATLSASVRPLTASIAFALRPSPAVTVDDAAETRCRLDPGESEASTTATVHLPVAGTATFDPPTVTATDRFGLFAETLVRGEETTATAEPSAPDDVRVRRGGATAAVFGEHHADLRGDDLDIADIREYVPGDPVNRIDWKTTARMNSPHVIEYESRADLRHALVFDRRAHLSVGRPGRTALDYLREVAVRVTSAAATAKDPVGLYVFDDEGPPTVLASSADTEQYRTVVSRLLDVTAATPSRGSTAANARPNATGRTRARSVRTPSAAEASERLGDDDSAFARSVRPFVATPRSDGERTADDPLLEACATVRARERGRLTTCIFTDDSDPRTLRESVRLARRNGNHVSVFLTPTVLFEPEAFADLETARERYRTFEALRRDLDSLDRVRAFEVASGDRLETVRSVGRTDGAAEETDWRRPTNA